MIFKFGFTRTNYFAVKDENRFRSILNDIVWEDDLKPVLKEADGKFSFVARSSIKGLCGLSLRYSTVEHLDGDFEPWDVYEALRDVVADDDAIIITNIEYDDDHLFSSVYLTIITSASISFEDLDYTSIEKARVMLGKPDFDTNFLMLRNQKLETTYSN